MSPGLAEACKANSTKDSVVETVRTYCGEAVLAEIDACMTVALKYNDAAEMRDEMNARYAGIPGDFGEELLAKGLSIFYVTAGNVRDTIVGGVNFGRDTDCVTAIASGFSGALSGSATIPADWIATWTPPRKMPNTPSRISRAKKQPMASMPPCRMKGRRRVHGWMISTPRLSRSR